MGHRLFRRYPRIMPFNLDPNDVAAVRAHLGSRFDELRRTMLDLDSFPAFLFSDDRPIVSNHGRQPSSCSISGYQQSRRRPAGSTRDRREVWLRLSLEADIGGRGIDDEQGPRPLSKDSERPECREHVAVLLDEARAMVNSNA